MKRILLGSCFNIAVGGIMIGLLFPIRLCGQALVTQNLDKKISWVIADFHGLPNYNQPAAPYGAQFPLELVPSSTSPSRAIDEIKRLQQSGFNGIVVGIVGGDSVSNDMESWLAAADAVPNFAVAPLLESNTTAQGVQLLEDYATLAAMHPSAATNQGKWVCFTYSQAAAFWQTVRSQASAIPTYFVCDDSTAYGNPPTTFPSTQVASFFPASDCTYNFTWSYLNYWPNIISLLNQNARPYAGGFMAGYYRGTILGGYLDASGTAKLSQAWEQALSSNLQWQTSVTWNDMIEHTDIRPSGDWNWTRADISNWYATKLLASNSSGKSPELYATTPQAIHLGDSLETAEALVLNWGTAAVQVKIQAYDGNQALYWDGPLVSVTPGNLGTAQFPETDFVDTLPAKSFLRMKALLYDASGHLLQSVWSAPVLVYPAGQQMGLNTLYYSVPASRALPGSVGLEIRGNPSMPGSAKAVITPPKGVAVRFAQLLENTQDVAQQFLQSNSPAYQVSIPSPLPANGRAILGGQMVTDVGFGFYVARVIDESERVGYSDPVYIAPPASTGLYEAESGTLGGTVGHQAYVQHDSAASAGATVAALSNPGAYVRVNQVDGGTQGGARTLTIRYASPIASKFSLYVNSTKVAQLNFPSTLGNLWGGKPSAFSTVTQSISVNSGTGNVISLQNDSGDGGGISLDSFSVPLPAASATPSVPANLTGYSENGSLLLSWDASPGATSYTVTRSSSSGGPFTIISQGSPSTSYEDSGLSDGTAYYYRVQAVNAQGTSADSSVATATPQASPLPGPPIGLAIYPGNAAITLRWYSGLRASSYSILRATAANGPFSTIATSTSTTYNDTVLTNGRRYWYQVVSIDADGTGEGSSVLAATPQPAPTSRYEAENGVLSGGASMIVDSAASGGKTVKGFSARYATDTIQGVSGLAGGGRFILTISYASVGNSTHSIYVNGVNAAVLTFPSTGSWGGSAAAFATISVPVILNPGSGNDIAIQTDVADNDLRLDYIYVVGISNAAAVYEAERGIFGNGAAIASCATASEGKYLGNLSATGAYNTISYIEGGTGGPRNLVIYYASTAASTHSLYVNGTRMGQLALPSTGGDGSSGAYAAFSTQITLAPGSDNSFTIQNDPGDSGSADIDYYTLQR